MQEWNISITYEPVLVETQNDGELETTSVTVEAESALDAFRTALTEWAGDSSKRYADIIISDLTAMPFETGEYERFETSLNYQTIQQIQQDYEGTTRDYLAQDLERITF